MPYELKNIIDGGASLVALHPVDGKTLVLIGTVPKFSIDMMEYTPPRSKDEEWTWIKSKTFKSPFLDATELKYETRTTWGIIPWSLLVFSPDGTKIAAARSRLHGNSRGFMVAIWNVQTTRLMYHFDENNCGVGFDDEPWGNEYFTSIAFSPDSSKLACGDTGNIIKIWDLIHIPSLDVFYIGDKFAPTALAAAAAALAAPPLAAHEESDDDDDWYVAFKEATNHVHTINAKDEHVGGEFYRTQERVWDILFSPDGTSIAFSTANNRADTNEIDIIKIDYTKLQSHPYDQELDSIGSVRLRDDSEVRCFVYSPDGTQFASGTINDIKIWDIKTETVVQTLSTGGYEVFRILWSSDGQTIAFVCSGEQIVNIWHFNKGVGIWEFHEIVDTNSKINQICFDYTGKQLIVATPENVQIWDNSKEHLEAFNDESSRFKALPSEVVARIIDTTGNTPMVTGYDFIQSEHVKQMKANEEKRKMEENAKKGGRTRRIRKKRKTSKKRKRDYKKIVFNKNTTNKKN